MDLLHLKLKDDMRSQVWTDFNRLASGEAFNDTSLVCQDGTIHVNRLTIGILFPSLSKSIEMAYFQEPTILLPDHDTASLLRQINTIFDVDLLANAVFNSEKEQPFNENDVEFVDEDYESVKKEDNKTSNPFSVKGISNGEQHENFMDSFNYGQGHEIFDIKQELDENVPEIDYVSGKTKRLKKSPKPSLHLPSNSISVSATMPLASALRQDNKILTLEHTTPNQEISGQSQELSSPRAEASLAYDGVYGSYVEDHSQDWPSDPVERRREQLKQAQKRYRERKKIRLSQAQQHLEEENSAKKEMMKVKLENENLHKENEKVKKENSLLNKRVAELEDENKKLRLLVGNTDLGKPV